MDPKFSSRRAEIFWIQIMDPKIQIMDPKFWERLSVSQEAHGTSTIFLKKYLESRPMAWLGNRALVLNSRLINGA